MSLVFNKVSYLKWFLLGALHAGIVYYMPQFTFVLSILSGYSGETTDFSIMSMASFSAIIYIVNLKITLISRTINYISLLSIIGSTIIFYVWLWLGNYLIVTFSSSILSAHYSPLFYLSILQTVSLAFIIDYFIEAFSFMHNPSPS